MYSTNNYSVPTARAVWEGIDAAFYASNYTVAGNRSLVIVQPDLDAVNSDIVAVVSKAVAEYPTLMGVLGPFSDATLMELLQSNVLSNNDLMALGPYTGSSTVRVWNPNVFFTRAEPLVELKVMLQYIIRNLRAKRIAYMHLTHAYYGVREFTEVQNLLESFARSPAVLYSAPYSTTDGTVNKTAFDLMADSNPQVVIVWGKPGLQTFEFARQVMLDARTSSAVIMSCFGLQSLLYDAYVNVTVEGRFSMYNNQILSTAVALSPTDNNVGIQHMALFSQEMGDFIANSGKSTYTLHDGLSSSAAAAASNKSTAEAVRGFFRRNAVASQLMVVGWLSGKLIQKTLNRIDWITDRKTYQTGIFEQNRFIVAGDAVFGDYGGVCNPAAALTGAMCKCNQGGHTGFMVSFTNDSVWSVMEDTVFTYTQALCHSADVPVPAVLSVLTFSLAGSNTLAASAARLAAILPTVFNFLNSTHVDLTMQELNATTANQQAVLDEEVDNHTVDVLVGPVADDLDFGDVLVVSPAFSHRRSNVAQRNVISLIPTLAQEVYILYSALPAIAAAAGVEAKLNVVLHGYNSTEKEVLSRMLSETAETYGYANPDVVHVDLEDDTYSALATTGLNLLIGLTDSDTTTIAMLLRDHPKTAVVADFKDFSLNYHSLLSYFTNATVEVQRRLVSFTNFPMWTEASNAAHDDSSLLTLFHYLWPDPDFHTPAYLEDTACALFLHQLALVTDVVNATNLVDALYLKGTISSYGMQYGRYQWSCTTTASGQQCTHTNFGARDITVFSMARVLDPSIAAVAGPITPSMIYTKSPLPEGNKLSSGQLIGIIVGSIIGGLLLISLILLFVFCCVVDLRNNNHAPKLTQEPVTIIFTDIESSTALWAALPQLMPDAVATHHRVIRSAIKKHKCYEVKTIGDSFMIACTDAASAVRLAADIQTRLLKYDWKTSEIDEAYRSFEQQRVYEDAGAQLHSAQLGVQEYGNLWNGLRVRIGVHTGLSDIRRDEVTKGFDYYGDTSNMAARTEAIANGGQVIVTEATWWALSDALREQLSCIKMGPQGLRGVPYAVEMYQLNPVLGRQYASLRTEIEAVLPDLEGATSEDGAVELLSSHSTMSGAATAISYVLASCFSTYPPAQRIRELQPLLSKWSVPAPPRAYGESDEDYCQGLLNRLAVRVGRVAEARLKQSAHDGGSSGASVLDSHMLAFASGMGPSQHNPLSYPGASTLQQPEYWEDGPQPFREHTAMGNSRDVFRSVVSPFSSLRSPSQRTRRCSSHYLAHEGMTVFDVSASRSGTTESCYSGVVETAVPAAGGRGRLTRRTHRASYKSEGTIGNSQLGE